MGALRIFLVRHRGLALLLVACALCVKALVPAGYMIGQSAKTFTVLVCADATGSVHATKITVPQTGKDGTAKAHESCPFSVLGFAALGGVDVVLLAAAIAFILALGFAAAPPLRLARARHVLPPGRGPPALI